VNIGKTRYGFVSREQNAGQSYNKNVGNKYFEIVTQLTYFGKNATNLNCMHKKVNSGLNLGTACYHSVHNILFSSTWLPPKKKEG